MTIATDRLDRLAIDTIRTLSIDAVQKANSGHPGAPMGAAPMAYVLWTRFLRHAPTRPDWPDRDRFVLSAGHASMLLYSLLHLTGYELPLSELEHFRQWGSRTPGHPEYGLTPGSRRPPARSGRASPTRSGWPSPSAAWRPSSTGPGTPSSTTGPSSSAPTATSRRDRLGGGIAGRAPSPGQADDALRRQPRPARRADLDGLQRGCPGPLRRLRLAHPAGARWQRPRGDLGGHPGRRSTTIDRASSPCAPISATGRPTSRTARRPTAPPLGPDEVRLTKEAYGWDPDRTFYVPDEAAALFSRAIPRGEQLAEDWQTRFAGYRAAFPADAAELMRRLDGDLRPHADRRGSRAMRWVRTSPPARPARRRSRTWPRPCPSCSAARRTCPSRT